MRDKQIVIRNISICACTKKTVVDWRWVKMSITGSCQEKIFRGTKAQEVYCVKLRQEKEAE